MKTTKRTTKTKQLKAELSQEAFLESLKRDGANNPTVEKFIAIMKQLTMNQAHFNVYDCFYYAKSFDLDLNEVKELFVKWCDRETQLQRLTKVEGVYDYAQYTVNSTASFEQRSVI
jgi:hypothetical protein